MTEYLKHSMSDFEGGEDMKVTIKGSPEEIAALAIGVQGQQIRIEGCKSGSTATDRRELANAVRTVLEERKEK